MGEEQTANALRCGECQEELQGTEGFCPACGAVAGSRCPLCGAALLPGWRHCARCGCEITEGDRLDLTCESCGGRVLAGYRHCPSCGEQRRPACPGCGQLLLRAWKCCPSCGRQLGRSGDQPEAEDRLSLSNLADQHNERGVDFLEEEDYERAAEEFQQAIELRRDDPIYYYNLGLAWENLGNDREAIHAYETAVRLDPGAAETHAALAGLYATKGRQSDAKKCWQAVIALAPDSDLAEEAKSALAQLPG